MARHRRVEALREENERLRKALGGIVALSGADATYDQWEKALDVARALLATPAPTAPKPKGCTCPDASHFPGTCP